MSETRLSRLQRDYPVVVWLWNKKAQIEEGFNNVREAMKYLYSKRNEIIFCGWSCDDPMDSEVLAKFKEDYLK